MIDPRIAAALKTALATFSLYSHIDAEEITDDFEDVFSSDEDFLTKVDDMDDVFDDNPEFEGLREVFFDLLMINFFIADAKKLEDDYLESAEWEAIEEQTIERGTELLNLLLYLNECRDEDIEPELEDYLKEFLLVDEDEFQDEYRIYEPVIAHQVLMESPVKEIGKVAENLADDSEMKELFYPLMCFFRDPGPSDEALSIIAAHAVNAPFDMAVLEILINFR